MHNYTVPAVSKHTHTPTHAHTHAFTFLHTVCVGFIEGTRHFIGKAAACFTGTDAHKL